MNEKNKIQIACSQVDTILNFYNKELLSISIPDEIREYIRKNKDKDYKFNVTPKNFNPEMLTEEAVAILLFLFRDYLANDRQKKIILNWEYPNKKESNIAVNFENYNRNQSKNVMNDNSLIISKRKNNIFDKIRNIIKCIFGKRNKSNE